MVAVAVGVVVGVGVGVGVVVVVGVVVAVGVVVGVAVGVVVAVGEHIMTTYRERLGTRKAEREIERRMLKLADWAEKNGFHVGIGLIDSGGDDMRPEHQASGLFGPHAGSGLAAAERIIDRALYHVDPGHATEIFNHLRDFINAQEKEYWEKVNQGEIP